MSTGLRAPRRSSDSAIGATGEGRDFLARSSSVGPDWPTGSVIHRGNGSNLRVVALAVSDDGETTFLVLEESYAAQATCVECGGVAIGDAEGWRATTDASPPRFERPPL